MGTRKRALVAMIVTASVLGSPGRAVADETDNLTCRNRPLTDSIAVLDALMNARIRTALARVNHRDDTACNASALPMRCAFASDLSSAYRRPLNSTRKPNPAASTAARCPAQGFVFDPGGLFSQYPV